MTVVSTERLADVFVELADTLVDEFDVIEFLFTITKRTAELIGDADVGLLLADQRGQLMLVAGSNEDVKRLELFQVQVHEGPCLDAFRDSHPVVNADLREAEDRWPQFAPRAAEAGYRSVHAFPLRLRHEVIGAIGVFGTSEAPWEDADAHIAQSLAHIATIGLLQERAVRHGELLTEQLQAALNSRIVLEQAKGAIAQFRNVSVDEAFEILRAHARRTQTRLVEVAHAALADPASLPYHGGQAAASPTVASATTALTDERERQRVGGVLLDADLRDSAAERRDRDAEARPVSDVGPQAWLDREWAGRDRDAAASDRAELSDIIHDRDRPDLGEKST